jgi:hypothetical protein
MTDATLPPAVAEWVAIRDEHIRHLEATVAELRTQLQARTAAAADELARVKQEHIAYASAYQQQSGTLKQEIQQWQSDYEHLRVQKGGFGFKALAAAATAGILVGLALGWLIWSHKDPQTIVFQQFMQQSGFQTEYAVRQRQFDEAARIIRTQSALGAYESIRPQLDFMANLVASAQLGFTEAGIEVAEAGYATKPPVDTSALDRSAARQLVVTDVGARLYTEARTAANIIATLQKKDQIGQWDRTAAPEKLRLVSKGKPGVAEDYWYEVETKTGQKGWVFGHFTNASLQRFRPDSVAVARDTTRRDTIKTQNR